MRLRCIEETARKRNRTRPKGTRKKNEKKEDER
jgi:hypothetical protein